MPVSYKQSAANKRGDQVYKLRCSTRGGREVQRQSHVFFRTKSWKQIIEHLLEVRFPSQARLPADRPLTASSATAPTRHSKSQFGPQVQKHWQLKRDFKRKSQQDEFAQIAEQSVRPAKVLIKNRFISYKGLRKTAVAMAAAQKKDTNDTNSHLASKSTDLVKAVLKKARQQKETHQCAGSPYKESHLVKGNEPPRRPAESRPEVVSRLHPRWNRPKSTV